MSSSVSMTVTGTDQLAAALKELEKQLTGPKAHEALEAGGRLIADEWARRVPEGEAPRDPHPGAYRRALESEQAVQVGGTEGGTLSVTIGPANLDDLPFDEQPHAYAGVLEYGDADQSPQPSARPAIDSAAPKAVQVIKDKLEPVAEAVHK